MRNLRRMFGTIAAVGLLVGTLGMPASAEAIGELGIPGLEGVCSEVPIVVLSLEDLIFFITRGAGNERSCVQACRMLGIGCFALTNNALSCQSSSVIYGTLIAQTLCFGVPSSLLLECILDVYATAADLRINFEQILGARAACVELGETCSANCILDGAVGAE